MGANAGDIGRDREAGQAATLLKCPLPDTGDGVRDCDRSQATDVIECKIPDASDREVSDHTGDRHITAVTRVSRDGDRAVVGCVIELGLRQAGRRQKRQ